jgi:hypothetical protein
MAQADDGLRVVAASSATSALDDSHEPIRQKGRKAATDAQQPEESSTSDLIGGVFDASDVVDWVFSIFDDD